MRSGPAQALVAEARRVTGRMKSSWKVVWKVSQLCHMVVAAFELMAKKLGIYLLGSKHSESLKDSELKRNIMSLVVGKQAWLMYDEQRNELGSL